MQVVFADSAAWIALINTRDDLHRNAWHVFNELQKQQTRLITTEFVFLEVADGLSAPSHRQKTVTFMNGLQNRRWLKIVPVSPSLYDEGWQLYTQRPDKEWSLTDCTSFAVMQQEGISLAFASDHHYEQTGFQKLM